MGAALIVSAFSKNVYSLLSPLKRKHSCPPIPPIHISVELAWHSEEVDPSILSTDNLPSMAHMASRWGLPCTTLTIHRHPIRHTACLPKVMGLPTMTEVLHQEDGHKIM